MTKRLGRHEDGFCLSRMLKSSEADGSEETKMFNISSDISQISSAAQIKTNVSSALLLQQ